MAKFLIMRDLVRVTHTEKRIVTERAELCIGSILVLRDPETLKRIPQTLGHSEWNPVGSEGEAIDGVIRIESGRMTTIKALTANRNPGHPALVWLRALADELDAHGYVYADPNPRVQAPRGLIAIDTIMI